MISSSDTFPWCTENQLATDHFHMTLFLCRRCLCRVLGCCVSLSCSPPASGCYTLPRPESATSTRLMLTPPGKQLRLIQSYSWRFTRYVHAFACQLCTCTFVQYAILQDCAYHISSIRHHDYKFYSLHVFVLFDGVVFSAVLYISGMCTQMVGSPPPLAGPLAENCDADQMAEITTQRGLSTLTSSGKSILCYQLEIRKLMLTIHFFFCFPMKTNTCSWQCQPVALFLGNRELGGAWEQGWSARVFSDLKLVTELFFMLMHEPTSKNHHFLLRADLCRATLLVQVLSAHLDR